VTLPLVRPMLLNKLKPAALAKVKLFFVIGSAIFDDLKRAAMFALFLAMRKRIVCHVLGRKLK
jgi:hypothetical protein